MNVLPNIFDKYERNARLFPAVLLLLPVVVAVAATLPVFEQAIAKYVTASIVLLAGAYAIMLMVRQGGRAIEPELWDSWEGAPSTRFMRWSDETFSDEWKKVAHKAVASALKIKLLSRKEEGEDKGKADKLISDAFAQVKSILKLEQPDGDHQVHNTEYGFTRNLLGSCFLGIVIAFGASAWCGYFWYRENDAIAAVGCIVSAVILAGFFLAKIFWLPKATKLAADRYAEKAWTTFIELKRDSAGGKKK